VRALAGDEELEQLGLASQAAPPRTVSPVSDYWMFLRELARAPLRTGALAPSSEALAALMVSEIDAQAGVVIELGPGTGRITEALLARGVPEDRVIVVEANPRFARLLQRRFPRILVRSDKAERLVRDPLPRAEEVSAVISGLPLPALGPTVQARILRDWYGTLPRARGFYQFTYAPVSPVTPARLRDWGLESTRLGTVVRNMPPATVYCFRRHRDLAPSRRISSSSLDPH
jgi:phospholipid N-methyltransferase